MSITTRRFNRAKPPASIPPATVLNSGITYTSSIAAHASYPDTNGTELKNGVHAASTDYTDPAWVGYNPANDVTLTFDLGSSKSLSSIAARLLHYPSVGIALPNIFVVESSDDNTSWNVVYHSEHFAPADTSIRIETWSWMASQDGIPGKPTGITAITARYIRITISRISAFIFTDDITFMGWNTPLGSATSQSTMRSLAGWRVASQEITAEARDMMLLYNQGTVSWTAAKLAPYTTYTNRATGAKDTMFPNFLFLAIQTADNARSFVADDQRASATIADWQWYLERTFSVGGDMAALEQAAAQTATDIGSSTYKVSVAIMIPLPEVAQTSFGSLPSGGASCNFTIAADQKRAVEWYITEVKQRFSAGNYPHIQFIGFYWMSETIDDVRYEETVRYTASVVHAADGTYSANQLKFFWIPWYLSRGIYNWRLNGFDVTAMQPNYLFQGSDDVERCEKAALFCQRYNLATELELDTNILTSVSGANASTYLTKYYAYLRPLIRYGCTGPETFRAYYQDVEVFYTATNTNDTTGLKAYDLTYKPTKGTLQESDLV